MLRRTSIFFIAFPTAPQAALLVAVGRPGRVASSLSCRTAQSGDGVHRAKLASEDLDRRDAMKRLQAESVQQCPECNSWFDSGIDCRYVQSTTAGGHLFCQQNTLDANIV